MREKPEKKHVTKIVIQNSIRQLIMASKGTSHVLCFVKAREKARNGEKLFVTV